MNLPRARHDDLLQTKLDDEVVVYDPERKQAHSLNRVAVAVWNHSDGTKSIHELQRLASDEVGLPVSEEAVWLGLRKLERARLLVGKLGMASPMTRREMLGKAGRYGAAAMATPLIVSALVPVAAAATSVCVGPNSPRSALQAVCGSTPNCLCTQTFGSGLQCVDTTAPAVGTCTSANPTCPALSVCVQIDSLELGDCRPLCASTCSC